jgi:uncharacterized membrane protein
MKVAMRCVYVPGVGSCVLRIMPLVAEEKFHRVLSESLWTWIGLIFALALLAWIISRVRAWYREDDDPAGNAREMLSEIREMYVEGDLSEEEFRSIKGRLTERLDRPATDTEN